MISPDFLSTEATGSSLDEAVGEALVFFGCSRAEVETEILQTPSSGFLGLWGRRPARVQVRLIDRAYIARRIAAHLIDLCGFDASVEVVPASQKIELEITCEDSSLIIGRHGQTLDALQSLVTTLTDRHGDDRTPIVLDIDGYRQRRIASLKKLARRLCGRVRRSGRPATLHPLPPEERRLLHQVFKEEDDIVSRSVGGGYERKMIISRRSD